MYSTIILVLINLTINVQVFMPKVDMVVVAVHVVDFTRVLTVLLSWDGGIL